MCNTMYCIILPLFLIPAYNISMSLTGDIVKHVVQVSAVALVITGVLKGWHQYRVATEHVPGMICDVVTDKAGLVTDRVSGGKNEVSSKTKVSISIKTDDNVTTKYSNVTPKDSAVSAKEAKEKKKRRELATGLATACGLGSLIYLCIRSSPTHRHTPDPDLPDRDSIAWIARDFIDSIGATYWDFAGHLGKGVQMVKFMYNKVDMKIPLICMICCMGPMMLAPDAIGTRNANLLPSSGLVPPSVNDNTPESTGRQGKEEQHSAKEHSNSANLPLLVTEGRSNTSGKNIENTKVQSEEQQSNAYEIICNTFRRGINRPKASLPSASLTFLMGGDQDLLFHNDKSGEYTMNILLQLSRANCKIAYNNKKGSYAYVSGIIIFPNASGKVHDYMCFRTVGTLDKFESIREALISSVINGTALPEGYSLYKDVPAKARPSVDYNTPESKGRQEGESQFADRAGHDIVRTSSPIAIKSPSDISSSIETAAPTDESLKPESQDKVDAALYRYERQQLIGSPFMAKSIGLKVQDSDVAIHYYNETQEDSIKFFTNLSENAGAPILLHLETGTAVIRSNKTTTYFAKDLISLQTITVLQNFIDNPNNKLQEGFEWIGDPANAKPVISIQNKISNACLLAENAALKNALAAAEDEKAKSCELAKNALAASEAGQVKLTSHIENLEKRISEECPRCRSA